MAAQAAALGLDPLAYLSLEHPTDVLVMDEVITQAVDIAEIWLHNGVFTGTRGKR
jgi:hypothetical protein